MRPLLPLAALLLAGCLEPRVSDDVEVPDLILAAGSPVPELDEDPVLGPQVAAADNLSGTVPLLSGFAAGKPVRWWSFGPAPDYAAPLFVLSRRGADGKLAPIGHPAIINKIPGDPGYTPFWSLTLVEVTSSYAGEIITSVAALQQARVRGLVITRPEFTGINVNCPIVGADVLLEVADGAAPVRPAGRFYYEGRLGHYYELGTSKLASDGVHVPIADLLVLRREGGAPLSEPARGVDMTGDGDLRDTNDILATGLGATFTPLARVVDVTVPVGTRSIDSSKNDTMAELRDHAELFTAAGQPVAANVVAYQISETLLNAPIAPEATP